MGCLADHTVFDFVGGRLSEEQLAHVDTHLDSCKLCNDLVVEVARSLAGEAAGTPTDGAVSISKIGRHELLGRLGSGGMGVVYAAYDADLDRNVAIKLLRVNAGAAVDPAVESELLLREARAMAKLSHPNVVQIYETSMHGESVALVMELVEGQTLGDWLVEEKRSWREIVAVFASASKGLSAAHEAGIVHGDFKPANVLIGDDGRVCVTDFGLARFEGEAMTERKASEREEDLERTLVQTMTTAGPIAGTPAYMAPEQFLGAKATAASDQFSFCVTLFEALYGRRPFPETTLAALKAAVLSGTMVSATRASEVPTWLHQKVMRGLRTRPAERHMSMRSIVEGLAKEPRRPWRAAVLVAGVGLSIAVGAWGYATRASNASTPPCASAGDALHSIWNQDAKAQLAASLVQPGQDAMVGDTLARVETSLDTYSKRWVAMQEESCQATRVRGEQSEELLDLRSACLNSALGEFSALVTGLYEQGGVDARQHAVQAALSLPGLERCGDGARLRASSPPIAEKDREALVALDREHDEIKTLQRLARFEDALERADDLVAKARSLGYQPLLVRSLLTLGAISDSLGKVDGAEANYGEARDVAARILDHHSVAEASVQLVRIIGYDKARTDEAMELARWAGAQVAQAGKDPLTLAKLHAHRGILHSMKGEYAAAAAQHQAALDLREKADASAMEIAESLHNLGGVNWQENKFEPAFSFMSRAAALTEATLGPDHPELAKSLMGLGLVRRRQEKYDEAAKYYERALGIFDQTYGRRHRLTSSVIDALAVVRDKQGKDSEALKLFEESLAMRKELFGREHILVSDSLNNIGLFLSSRKRYVEAIESYQEAYRLRQAALPPGHPKMGQLLMNMGAGYAGAGEHQEARIKMEAGIAILAKVPGLERGLGESHMALAFLLADHLHDPKAARLHGQSARAAFVAQGPGSEDLLADADAWLAKRTR